MSALAEAQAAFRSRDFDRAEKLLSVELKNNPTDPTLLLRMGQVCMAQGKFLESIESLRAAQKHSPDDPKVYRSLAMAIRMSGQVDLGISYLGVMLTRASLVLQPQIHLSLAELFAAKGDHESLRNSLQLIGQLPVHDARMELRLWAELADVKGMRSVSVRAPERVDLIMGLSYEEENPSKAEELLLRSSCSSCWEAQIALYRLRKESIYLQKAHQLAPKTAEVLVYVCAVSLPNSQAQETLQSISKSPVVFASVRQKAQGFLT